MVAKFMSFRVRLPSLTLEYSLGLPILNQNLRRRILVLISSTASAQTPLTFLQSHYIPPFGTFCSVHILSFIRLPGDIFLFCCRAVVEVLYRAIIGVASYSSEHSIFWSVVSIHQARSKAFNPYERPFLLMLYAFDAANWSPALEAAHRAPNGLKGLAPGDIVVYDFRGTSGEEGVGAVPTAGGDAPLPLPPPPPRPPNAPLRVVQWNIERGYKLDAIAEELARLDADVITLQELDISCERSAFQNVPLLLAKRLGALCAFVCEFHELPSTAEVRRAPDTESGCDYAFHGNAIITRRHALHSLRAFEHSCGLDWAACGAERKEPRLGTRYVLAGCIDECGGLPVTSAAGSSPSSLAFVAGGGVPANAASSSFVRVQLYTLHLEIFCGPLMRLRQLSDALGDAKVRRREFYTEMAESFSRGQSANNSLAAPHRSTPFYGDGAASSPSAAPPLLNFAVPLVPSSPTAPISAQQQQQLLLHPSPYLRTLAVPAEVPLQQRHFSVILGGDLNTIMHGIVRFSSLYSDDRTRWMSLGETEAEWLQRKVFSLPRGRLFHQRGACGTASSVAKAPPLSAGSAPQTRAEHNAALIGGRSESWLQWLRGLYWRYCYGVHVAYSARLSNEELKFYDVFDKLRDITLDNPAYKGFVSGKLDWLLLSNLRVVGKAIGNNDYAMSDHKYLLNEVVLPPFSGVPPGAEFLMSPTTAAATAAGTNGSVGGGGGGGRSPVAAGAVGNSSFFWCEESLAAAYGSHKERRSLLTSAVRIAYVGVAAALAVYVPYRASGYLSSALPLR